MAIAGFERSFDAQPTPTTPPKKGKKQKGFWQDQISTGGGIGGALAGAAGGAAIGSVVPVVGTAVGGLLGALLGGGIGSAGGEVAENAMTGDDLGKNVLQEGLIGGVTSLPIGAGFKLAKAGVQATTGIGKTGARELVQQAGAQTVGKKTAAKYGLTAGPTAASKQGGRTTTAGKLTQLGDKALASQYGVLSKPTIRNSNPAKTVAQLADYGITNPVDAERIASGITGSSGILTRQVGQAVDAAGGVNTSTLRQIFTDALDAEGVVDAQRKSLTKMFDAQMGRLNGGARGSLNPKANATEALAVMKDFEKRIAEFKGKGGTYHLPTSVDGQQANVMQLVRDELEDSIYKGAGANGNVAGLLTPQLREELIGLMPNNAKWAQYVDNGIMKSSDVGALRSAQAPFVNIGRIIDEGADNAFSAGGRMVNSANGIRGAITDAATNLVKNPVLRGTGTALRTAGGAAGAVAPKAAGQGIIPLTARQGLTRAVLPGEQAPQEMSLEGALTAPQGQEFTSTLGLDTGEQTNSTGYSSQELGQALMQAYAANDTASAEVLQQMYELASQQEAASAGSGLSATTGRSVATSANAINTLDQLEGLFSAAGNGNGKVGGAFQNLMAGAGLDDNAASYNALSASATSQLAKAINGSGQVSDADAAALIKALPLLTDSPQVAAQKFASLRARLATAQENTMLYGGGGGTDIESALMNAGY